MPFDIGFGELVVIGVLALIVIGPKDLPNMFRAVGRATGRMRAMADDFRRTLESAADDAGVNDVRRDFNDVANFAKSESGIDEAQESIREINNMRVAEIDKDANELEADLDEVKQYDAEMKKKSAPKKSASKKPATKKAASKSSAKSAAKAKPTQSPSKKTTPKKPKSDKENA